MVPERNSLNKEWMVEEGMLEKQFGNQIEEEGRGGRGRGGRGRGGRGRGGRGGRAQPYDRPVNEIAEDDFPEVNFRPNGFVEQDPGHQPQVPNWAYRL